MKFGKICFTAGVLFLANSGVFAQEDGQTILPYRPSVSTPAQLPTPGQLEFELGWQRIKQGDVRRDSFPFQFKLAFDTRWGVLIGGETLVTSSMPRAATERGYGDTSVVLKRAFIVDEISAFGLELGSKIATAKNTIGSGKNDVNVNGIYSRDLGLVHMDANVSLTHLGFAEPGSASLQKAWATSFSMPIAEK